MSIHRIIQIIDATTALPPTSSSIVPTFSALRQNVTTDATNTTDGGGLYPPELFNMEQKRNGAVILYCFCQVF